MASFHLLTCSITQACDYVNIVMDSSQESVPINDMKNTYFIETHSLCITQSQALSLLSECPTIPLENWYSHIYCVRLSCEKFSLNHTPLLVGPKIYNGHGSSFKIHTTDCETTTADIYIMPSKQEKILSIGRKLAIAAFFASFVRTSMLNTWSVSQFLLLHGVSSS